MYEFNDTSVVARTPPPAARQLQRDLERSSPPPTPTARGTVAGSVTAERQTNDTTPSDVALVERDADAHTRCAGGCGGGGTALTYRDRVPESSNTTTNANAHASDALSSDTDATFPPAGQRAPPSPSTPPRSASALPSSSSTAQPTRLGLSAAAPTSSPDPLRILPTPSSAASANSSGSRPRSRSRSQSAPVLPSAKVKVVSRTRQAGPGSDDASVPSSSAPARRQLGATSSTATAQDTSSTTVGSAKLPRAHRTRLSADIIVEESPAEDGELRRPSTSATTGKDKSGSRASFDHVEVPYKRRQHPSRTGANENEPDNETTTSPSRKTSVSRTSSAPPAPAASPPVLTQSQTTGSSVPDFEEPSRSLAETDLDASSAKTSSASSRQYQFAVVVPQKSLNASISRRPSQVSDSPATPPDKPSAVPGPANEGSSELSSPPTTSPALSRTTLTKRSRSPQRGDSTSSPEPGPSQSPVKKRKEAAPATRTTGSDLDGDSGPAQSLVLAGKRPRRAAAKPGTLKESSSEAGSDDKDDESESSFGPKKRPKTNRALVARPVRPAVRKRVASESTSARKKGKECKVKKPPSSAPLSTQTRSVQLLELAKLQPAPRETPEQRQDKWVLNRMDVVVWTLVEHDSTRFWWPANIQSKPRSLRPLKLSLIADSSEEISVINPAREVALDEPAPTNLLSFRSTLRAIVRFDRANYVEEAGAGAAPSPEAFERALAAALLMADAELDDDESDSDSDCDLAPAAPAASKGTGAEQPAPRAAKKVARANVVAADLDSDGEPAAIESDDELTKGFTEIESITAFPFRCVARYDGLWWGALCVSYDKPGASKSTGKSSPGFFNVEFTDGTDGRVKRTDLALPSEAKFFQVKLGETKLAVDDDYASQLAEFVQHEGAVWQSIIDDQFAPAAVWNSDFYAGGSRRRELSKKARYGELLEEHRDALSEALRAWALPKTGARPTGSAQYEALSDTNRSIYVADVLLSIAVVLVIVEERSFGEVAREALGISQAEHEADHHRRTIMDEAFKLAQKELEKSSLTKWVLSVRSARAQATANRKKR